MRKNLMKNGKMSLIMAALMMSLASMPAYGAMWPSDPSSLNVISYPLDSKSRSIPAYSDPEMTNKIGTVYGSDRCTILSASGSAVLVEYPIKGGRTKTGYVAVSAFSDADLNGGTPQGMCANTNITVFAYRTGNQKIGTIFCNDSINILCSDYSSGRSQTIYPTSSGYKMGWIDWLPESHEGNSGDEEAGAAMPEGTYIIRSAMDSNMVVDVFAGTQDPGTNIQLYRQNNGAFNGANQQFQLISAGSNWYKIVSVLDQSMSLDVYGGTSTPGSNICLWQYHGDDQLWKFVPCDNGQYMIKSRLDLYLDVENNECCDGANIIGFTRNGNANQRWILEPVSANGGSTAENGSEEAKIRQKLEDLANGVYGNGYALGSVYQGAGQCKGFASSVHSNLFGFSIGRTGNKGSGKNYLIEYDPSRTSVVGSLAEWDMSKEALQNLFSKARPGDFVQIRRRNEGSHSMIFCWSDGEGATFYECNLDGHNKITRNYYTWSQLYNKNMALSLYTARDYWLH